MVDDQPQIRRVLRTALVAKGYEVDDACDGQEAFEKLREGKYDVILLDINLPDIKGNELCQAIRSTSDVGIIMLTVRNSEADKVAALTTSPSRSARRNCSLVSGLCCGGAASTGETSVLA